MAGDWNLKPTGQVSVRDLADAGDLSGTVSLRAVAQGRNIPWLAFSIHDLLTPQFKTVPNDFERSWENWLQDYEGGTSVVKPTTKREFIGATVDAARDGRRIRAVGSGHSHSRAAQPDEQFVDLSGHVALFRVLNELEEVLEDIDGIQDLFERANEVSELVSTALEYPAVAVVLADYGTLHEVLERADQDFTGIPGILYVARNFGDLYDLRTDLLSALRALPDPPYGHEGLLEQRWLKSAPPGIEDGEQLVRVKSGTVLKRLLRTYLADRDLALANMGSWDGQTIAGAINTGTHGTGVELPSLADMVRSVDLITVTESHSGEPLVQCRRIEPDDGITDPAAFAAARADHHTVLHQSDNLFHAVVQGYGCLGLVYSYTLAVEDGVYWLDEYEQVTEYPDLLAELEGPMTLAAGHAVPETAAASRHVSLLVNVARMQGSNGTRQADCLLKTRDRVSPEGDPTSAPERRFPPVRAIGQWFEQGIDPRKTRTGLGKAISNHRINVDKPPFEDGSHTSAYYVALRRMRNRRPPSDPPVPPKLALSTEVAVPAHEVGDAIETVVSMIRTDDLFYAVPLGVRFVAPSSQYLSPEYDRLAAMIEIPILVEDTNDLFPPVVDGGDDLTVAELRDDIAKPALSRIQRRLINEYDGRPHLGKHNDLDREDVERLFPAFDDWLAVYDACNPFGTFNNGFTDQLGISR